MKFYLIVAKGKHRGRPIPIEVDLFVIGSAPTCQLRADHRDLGEQHCALVNRGKKVFVRDLGSGKPTAVNDQPLPASEEWPLHKGDRLAAGPLAFRLSFHEKMLSQRDLEEWALRSLDEDAAPRPTPAALAAANVDVDDSLRGVSREFNRASAAAAALLSQAQSLRGERHGRLRISHDGPVTVVRVNDLYLVEEAELRHLMRELNEHLTGPNVKALLDLKDVRRMSASAVGLFADLNERLRQTGGSLAICRLRPELAGLVSDLRNLFNIRVYDDKDKAIAASW